jgi:NADPH:quinone reductase-like Zn-dependent oxidoreductase
MQKAWFYEEYGPKEALKQGDFPVPTPLHNQLLVQVRAAALNPIDFKRRQRPIFPSDFPVSRNKRQIYICTFVLIICPSSWCQLLTTDFLTSYGGFDQLTF